MRALLVVAALLAVPSAAVADKARADKLFEEGRGYLQRKEYALACTAFEQSQEADPAIGTQLNIALCYEQWGKLTEAYTAYVDAEKQAKLKKDNRVKVAHKKVTELEPKLAHLRVSIPPDADPYAIYLFDDKEITRDNLAADHLLDAGTHKVEVRAAGSAPKVTTIDVAGGEHKSITVELPRPVVTTPDNNHNDNKGGGDTGTGGGTTTTGDTHTETFTIRPRKKGKLFGGIGLMAGGGIAIGVASYVALVARSDYNDAIAKCPGNICTFRTDYDATQDARKRANLATIITGGGVALVGVGLFLVLTSKGEPVKVEKVSAGPLLTPDGVGLAIGGAL